MFGVPGMGEIGMGPASDPPPSGAGGAPRAPYCLFQADAPRDRGWIVLEGRNLPSVSATRSVDAEAHPGSFSAFVPWYRNRLGLPPGDPPATVRAAAEALARTFIELVGTGVAELHLWKADLLDRETQLAIGWGHALAWDAGETSGLRCPTLQIPIDRDARALFDQALGALASTVRGKTLHGRFRRTELSEKDFDLKWAWVRGRDDALAQATAEVITGTVGELRVQLLVQLIEMGFRPTLVRPDGVELPPDQSGISGHTSRGNRWIATQPHLQVLIDNHRSVTALYNGTIAGFFIVRDPLIIQVPPEFQQRLRDAAMDLHWVRTVVGDYLVLRPGTPYSTIGSHALDGRSPSRFVVPSLPTALAAELRTGTARLGEGAYRFDRSRGSEGQVVTWTYSLTAALVDRGDNTVRINEILHGLLDGTGQNDVRVVDDGNNLNAIGTERRFLAVWSAPTAGRIRSLIQSLGGWAEDATRGTVGNGVAICQIRNSGITIHFVPLGVITQPEVQQLLTAGTRFRVIGDGVQASAVDGVAADRVLEIARRMNLDCSGPPPVLPGGGTAGLIGH